MKILNLSAGIDIGEVFDQTAVVSKETNLQQVCILEFEERLRNKEGRTWCTDISALQDKLKIQIRYSGGDWMVDPFRFRVSKNAFKTGTTTDDFIIICKSNRSILVFFQEFFSPMSSSLLQPSK